MSSTLLYRAFGFRQYQCPRMTTEDGIITLHLEQDPKHDRCSHCQSPDVIRHGTQDRIVRTVPIGGKPVELRLPVPRLGCRKCGLVRQAGERKGTSNISASIEDAEYAAQNREGNEPSKRLAIVV